MRSGKGRITDVRFASLADSCEQEENQIQSNIQEWQAELDIISDTKEQTKLFADGVKKYTNIKELTVLILNELIKKLSCMTRKLLMA